MENDYLTTDEFLEHFGVMGMKWGVRKSKKETGVSRYRQAKVERNNNLIKYLTGVKKGEHHQRTKAFGEKIIGAQQWQDNYKTTVSTLRAQNKRLVKKGKLSFADRMAVFTEVGVGDLFITQTPNKKKFNPYVKL